MAYLFLIETDLNPHHTVERPDKRLLSLENDLNRAQHKGMTLPLQPALSPYQFVISFLP